MIHIENLNITINVPQPLQPYVNSAPDPNFEEQLRDMLKALDMVHTTPSSGVSPQLITPITGKAKDNAVDEILENLRVHYFLTERGMRQYTFK